MQQATVNLFADMGVQPLTLQNGADGLPLQLASVSDDIFAPTSTVDVRRPPARRSPSGTRVTITGTATEHGGGAVAGVEVSVDGIDLARRADADARRMGLRLAARRHRHRDDPHARDRRQRQPRISGPGDDGERRRRRLPVHEPVEALGRRPLVPSAPIRTRSSSA